MESHREPDERILVLPGLLLYTLVNGVLRRRYPKEEFLEWGRDAHGPYAVHEVWGIVRDAAKSIGPASEEAGRPSAWRCGSDLT